MLLFEAILDFLRRSLGSVLRAMFGWATFALFGETTADLPPEDIYALHCCWELEVENDSRAPQERSAAAGRELLKRAGNAGF